MPSRCRRFDVLALLAGPPSSLSGSIARPTQAGPVRLSASVLGRVLVPVHAVRGRQRWVGGVLCCPPRPTPFPVADPALALPVAHAGVLRRVRMPLRAVRDLATRILGPVGLVADGRALALAGSAVPLPVCRYARVLSGVRVSVRALRFSGVPVRNSAACRVLGIRFESDMCRVHAASVRARVPSRALAGNMALVICHKAIRYRTNQRPVRNEVAVNRLTIPRELGVADAGSTGPAPATVGVNSHLFPEALGEAGVTECGRGGTVGHVRLLHSRTVPRECVRTRRGFSRHFTGFPFHPSGESHFSTQPINDVAEFVSAPPVNKE